MVAEPIEWRITPKSRDIVAIAPPVRLEGTVRVEGDAECSRICVAVNETQKASIAHWLSQLPSEVLESTAESDGCIAHEGTYNCIDSSYRATTTQWPRKGEQVAIRIAPSIVRIGSLRKAQLRITDVMRCDVPAERTA